MRRAASSVLVAIGLFAASVAWWSFAARFTVLDSGRSARIADTLIDQPVIRDAVAKGLASALRQALPPGTPIDPDALDAVAHQALEDPRALAALGAIGVSAVGPMIAPAVLLVSTGIAALLGARAWRLTLAALPPAPPSGGPQEPVPTPAATVPATRSGDPFRRSREPVGTAGRTWRF